MPGSALPQRPDGRRLSDPGRTRVGRHGRGLRGRADLAGPPRGPEDPAGAGVGRPGGCSERLGNVCSPTLARFKVGSTEASDGRLGASVGSTRSWATSAQIDFGVVGPRARRILDRQDGNSPGTTRSDHLPIGAVRVSRDEHFGGPAPPDSDPGGTIDGIARPTGVDGRRRDDALPSELLAVQQGARGRHGLPRLRLRLHAGCPRRPAGSRLQLLTS